MNSNLGRGYFSSKRVLYALCVVVGLLVCGVVYFRYNPSDSVYFPKCPFLLLTGLQCPWCGSQRAVHALLHLDFYSAFRYNALLVLSIPYIFLLLTAKVISYVPRFSRFPHLPIQHPIIIWSYLALVLLFWITRNIFQ